MVKTRGIEDGVYELSIGTGSSKKSVRAVRQPDKYFQIELDGKLFKGYLKDIKETFASWAQGAAPEEPAASRAATPAPERSARGGLRERPRGVSKEELLQWEIDSSETNTECAKKWVAAYNAGHRPLLPNMHLEPPMKKCYDKANDRYTWPEEFPKKEKVDA
jgi:hypothetical protein